MTTQLIGILLVVAGAFLFLGPWALIGGGSLLLVAPEIAALVRERRVTRRHS